MEIIPAIDIINGQCVRLTKGNYTTKKIYRTDPVEVAHAFEGAGIRRIHVVDLDGAKAKTIVNHKVLEALATKTDLHIDFGGGLKSTQDVETAFNCGATQITGGSIAVAEPFTFLEWIERFGTEKIILGADVNNGKVATNGWQKESALSCMDLLDVYKSKVKYIISTDIQRDGMLAGPSFQLYEDIQLYDPQLKVIASGGISCMDDLIALREQGCFGAIVGKAYYEGKISLQALADFQTEIETTC